MNGQAFSLNGSAYLTDPSPAFSLAAANFTISALANFTTLNTSIEPNLPNTLVAQDDGGGVNNKWVMYCDSSDGSPGFHENVSNAR